MPADTYQRLLDFLARLRAAGVHFELTQIRPETIAVEVAVPGQRWEVEFFADGSVEIERFRSSGDVETDESLLDHLITEFGD
jgi:hypothetical protein